MNNLTHSRKLAARLFGAALLLATIASALAEVHYVDLNSTNATPPYTNWTIAATNIQDAVDAAVAGDEVVVTNGLYSTGGRVVDGTITNRVVVDKPLSVRSVNGAESTIIEAVLRYRCAYLVSGASLSGFTLRDGDIYGNEPVYGGGAFGGTLNNCTLTGNGVYSSHAHGGYGGGAAYCMLNNCTLAGNWAHGSADSDGTYGGGAAYCTLNNCTLSGNSAMISIGGVPSASAYGGGAAYSTLNNCTLTGNQDYDPFGGGAYRCQLYNCTLTGNNGGGGAYLSQAFNCILYDNSGHNSDAGLGGSTLRYCCTTPLPNTGIGNITNAPLFVDQAGGNFRLQPNSPCINAGNNLLAPAGPDLDGNPRIVGGTVDIGAYEYQSLSLISFGVVSNQFGFIVTGQSNWMIVLEASSDFTDWTPLTTNTLSGSPFPFRDPTPPILPQRFYRARKD